MFLFRIQKSKVNYLALSRKPRSKKHGLESPVAVIVGVEQFREEAWLSILHVLLKLSLLSNKLLAGALKAFIVWPDSFWGEGVKL